LVGKTRLDPQGERKLKSGGAWVASRHYISDPTDVAWPVFICAMPVS
jgi:hypothetical protein